MDSTRGNRVVFTRAGREFRGTVEDDVGLLEPYDDREFWDLIQYIRWDDGGHSIRICYYVRDRTSENEPWIFANRTLSINPDYLKKLFEKASKKEWFREVL